MLKATKTDLFPFCRLTMHVMCSKIARTLKTCWLPALPAWGSLWKERQAWNYQAYPAATGLKVRDILWARSKVLLYTATNESLEQGQSFGFGPCRP